MVDLFVIGLVVTESAADYPGLGGSLQAERYDPGWAALVVAVERHVEPHCGAQLKQKCLCF